MPAHVWDILTSNLGLAPYQVYTLDGPIGMANLIELLHIDRPDLKDPPYLPGTPRVLATGEPFFSVIARRDVLLYPPYNTFGMVVDFLQQVREILMSWPSSRPCIGWVQTPRSCRR